ncbi:hypothetical protein [Microcystis sp. LE19-195.1E]|uniref:hypothetical protein n=1 Tax=Microcystis sp. LE19-195.1E TaxID=3016440 RepID=UPI0025865AD2|nr:hypothetical protein [Microcystis sp. LE19-195.1E]
MHILPILRKLSRSINRQPVKYRSQESGVRRQEIIFIYFSHTPHPTPYTPHPTPHTPHPTPYTPHPTPHTPHPTPYTPHPTPQSLGLVYVSRGQSAIS